jgi:hypothetical protein
VTARFQAARFSRADCYSLGRDSEPEGFYLAIPVSNPYVDYEEYYRLSEAEFETLLHDLPAARAFADRCRRHEMDDRLILQPGQLRGDPRWPQD